MELVIFKHQRKKIYSSIKLRFNRKKIYTATSIIYFGVKIGADLNWNQYIHDTAIKQNRNYLQLEIC